MTKKKVTFGISFPDERVLQLAREKAKKLGLSFSAYVNQVLRRDLNMPNAFSTDDDEPERDTSKHRDEQRDSNEHTA